ncbi:MAG: hypothetical protein AB8H86_15195 [Polyangiales bacterium]
MSARRILKSVSPIVAGPFSIVFIVVLLAGMTIVHSRAEAHLGHVVLRAERYLKFDVEPAALRIVTSLTLGPAEMARIMRDADTNQDGAVDGSEADVYMRTWGEGLAEELSIEVDGEPVAIVWGDAYLDPQGVIRNEAGSVEMVARVELRPGTHQIRLGDAMPTEALDRSDIVIRTQPGGVVHTCSYGDEPHDCGAPIALPAATSSEIIGLSVDVAGLRTWQLGLMAGGAALLLLMSGVIFWRRRSAVAPADGA